MKKKSLNAMDIFTEIQKEESMISEAIDNSRTEIDLKKFARNVSKMYIAT